MSLQKNRGAVSRFARALKFSAWLQALPGRMTPPPFRLIQIGSAFWQSRALFVAARLDIATVLGGKSMSADQLAQTLAADADALARLLRMLASAGVFEETAPRTFRNNDVSSHLRTDNPRNVRAMVLLHNDPVMSRPWLEQLESGVRSGESPFRLCHGAELFGYLDQHPDFDRRFSDAMDSVEALVGDSFATDFDWARFERVIDLGGSRGSKALAILQRHNGLQALVVDRPQVVAEAEQYRAAHPSPGSGRLRFQAGDLLEAIPVPAGPRDVYLLSAVLHALDDDTAVRVVDNLARAIGDSGACAALLELVLPETGADSAATGFDMQMFVGSRGRERTLKEWEALIRRGGMRLEEVVGLRSLARILVIRRG